MHVSVPSDFVVVILARLFETIHFYTLYPKPGDIIANQMRIWFPFFSPAIDEFRERLISVWWLMCLCQSIWNKVGRKTQLNVLPEKPKVRPIQTNSLRIIELKWNGTEKKRKHADARRVSNGFSTLDRMHAGKTICVKLYFVEHQFEWGEICLRVLCAFFSWQSNLNSFFVVRNSSAHSANKINCGKYTR